MLGYVKDLCVLQTHENRGIVLVGKELQKYSIFGGSSSKKRSFPPFETPENPRYFMQIVKTRRLLEEEVYQARSEGKRIGFVPTLGALHAGHMSLVAKALETCDFVVASVFVNPTQFNDDADFDRYPRQVEQDAALLEQHGCHLLYTPGVEEVYADKESREYDLGGLDQVLEGPLRPGHFNGVVNVVERLFEHVKPDAACFGKKDRQQLAILSHANRTADWGVEIIPCDTIRESDGLAMSSRNALLDADERKRAVGLYKALCLAEEDAFKLELPTVKRYCRDVIERHGMRVEYFDIIHPYRC